MFFNGFECDYKNEIYALKKCLVCRMREQDSFISIYLMTQLLLLLLSGFVYVSMFIYRYTTSRSCVCSILD